MKVKRCYITTIFLFTLFICFTLIVMNVDVHNIGPEDSSVGLATINSFVHDKLGINMVWYNITDCLGIISILIALFFGVIGFVQLIQRKSLLKIDIDIIFLGIFYIIMIASYVFFEVFIINYRPIILDDGLEASYPSSHSMLVICIISTTMLQIKNRIKNKHLRIFLLILSTLILIITICGRLLSGVHWFTDIVGGILLGGSLFMVYYSLIRSYNAFDN